MKKTFYGIQVAYERITLLCSFFGFVVFEFYGLSTTIDFQEQGKLHSPAVR